MHAGRFAEISSDPDYKILVLEDTETGKVVGTASLIVERKFLRGLGKVIHNDNSRLLKPRHCNLNTVKLTVLAFCPQCGHIEDVVIDSSKRGQKLGARCAFPPCLYSCVSYRLATVRKHLYARMFCLFDAIESHWAMREVRTCGPEQMCVRRRFGMQLAIVPQGSRYALYCLALHCTAGMA